MKWHKFLTLSALALTLSALIPFSSASAQETTTPDATQIIEQPQIPLKADAGEDQNAVIGKNVLFNAARTTSPQGSSLIYNWDFGDGTSGEGVDPTHTYKRSGVYRVMLTIQNGNETSKDDVIISVEEHLAILITDQSVKDTDIQKIYDYGITQGVLVINVRDDSKDSNFIVTQNLVQKLLLSQNDIKFAEIVITKTASNVGLSALGELAQAAEAQGQKTLNELNWEQKTVLAISEGRGSARIAQATYNLLNPEKIILAKDEAIFPALSASTTSQVLPKLQEQGIDYQIINAYSQRAVEEINPFNFVSIGLNYLINRGVDQNTILLILSLPVIATIITIGRQIIGIKAFGIYIPSIIALTFVVTSLKFGLIIFLVLLITGTITRLIAKRLRLLYLPRMALVLTIVSLSILGMFFVATLFNKPGFLTISIFPILIMTILTERFVEAQIEKGARAATRLTAESLILSIISYYIVTWERMEKIILGFPEIIILVIILNILLGRFTGLRLTEYLRFINLLRHESNIEPKKNPRNE